MDTYSLPWLLPPMRSDDFAEATKLLREDVAAAFDRPCNQIGDVPALLKRTHATWLKGKVPLRPMPSTSPRDFTHAQLYARHKPSGRCNHNRLHEADEAALEVVEAVIAKYMECQAWREVAAEELTALPRSLDEASARALFDKRDEAIERVQVQIAPYYTHRLVEQGYTLDQGIKIVGNAIRAFADIAEQQHAQRHRPTVKPTIFSEQESENIWQMTVGAARKAADDAARERNR